MALSRRRFLVLGAIGAVGLATAGLPLCHFRRSTPPAGAVHAASRAGRRLGSWEDLYRERWTWDSVALTQQRLWQHWLEAGSTWLTWWAGSLPPMGWPPVGQVLPPAADPAPPLHSADHAPTRRTAPRQPSAQPRTHRARERRP